MIGNIDLAKMIEEAGGMEVLKKDEASGLWIIPTVPETLVTFRALEGAEKVLMLKQEVRAKR